MVITLGYNIQAKEAGYEVNLQPGLIGSINMFRYILRKRGMEVYNQHIDLLFLISVTDSDIILFTYPNHKSAGLIALYKRN